MADKLTKDILDKAAKLQALAGSSNVNEAALAAAKLQELLFRHNLQMADIRGAGEKSRYGRVGADISHGGPATIVNWKRGLLNVVAKNNFCSVVVAGVPKEIRKGTNSSRVWILGEEHNIIVVRHMYAYLLDNILQLAERDWKIAKMTVHTTKIRWLNSFYEGAVSTIWERLRAQRKEDIAQEGGSALVIVKDEEMKDFTARMFPDATKVARSAPSSGNGYDAGRKAAEEIGLDKQVRPSADAKAIGR